MSEGEGVLPLVADLASERCPERAVPGAAPAAVPRFLDTRKLAKSLRNRVGLLRKGESPAKLALGEDCVQPSCEQTLVFLFRQWCQAKPGLAHRRGAAETAQICNDLEAIHHTLSGGTARRKVEQKELTQKQRQEIETLGRIRTTDDEQPTGVRQPDLEEWRIEEDSAQGLHLVRPAATGGKRYAHGQLVAVRPSDASSFILGQVRWLMGADNGDLHAGIKLMPGAPGATTIRALGLNESERTSPALTLGPVPKLEPRATLILPAGWFKPGKTIEVVSDKPAPVRLTEVVERGSDFERVAYERP